MHFKNGEVILKVQIQQKVLNKNIQNNTFKC